MEKKILPITVLIPTMNRLQTLKRTLNIYLNSEWLPAQIVVVDQSTSEKTAVEIKRLVEEIRGRIETVYVYQTEPSLTKARNTAFSYAKHEVIVCSDDDIDIYSDTLKQIYDLMSDKQIAMIAGLDDNASGTTSKIGYLLGTKSFSKRNIGHVTWSMLGRFPNKITEQTDTMWAMGFFFVIRKSLADKWKLMWDEKLTGYAYAEDLDYTYGYYKRAKAEKLKCIMSDRVHVKHMVSGEYRTPTKKSAYMYVLNRAYLSYKHQMGWKSDIAIRWCNFWRFVEWKIKKQNAECLKEAMRYWEKHRFEIQKGKFPY